MPKGQPEGFRGSATTGGGGGRGAGSGRGGGGGAGGSAARGSARGARANSQIKAPELTRGQKSAQTRAANRAAIQAENERMAQLKAERYKRGVETRRTNKAMKVAEQERVLKQQEKWALQDRRMGTARKIGYGAAAIGGAAALMYGQQRMGSQSSGQPKMGEKRNVGGRPAQWNGKQWIAISGTRR